MDPDKGQPGMPMNAASLVQQLQQIPRPPAPPTLLSGGIPRSVNLPAALLSRPTTGGLGPSVISSVSAANTATTSTTPTPPSPATTVATAITPIATTTSTIPRPPLSGGLTPLPIDPPDALLPRAKLQEMVAQMDPNQRLDSAVEEILLDIAEDFLDSITIGAVALAKHRNSTVLETRDLASHLERHWDIRVPGFAIAEEAKPGRKLTITEPHKQRLAALKKTTVAADKAAAKQRKE